MDLAGEVLVHVAPSPCGPFQKGNREREEREERERRRGNGGGEGRKSSEANGRSSGRARVRISRSLVASSTGVQRTKGIRQPVNQPEVSEN